MVFYLLPNAITTYHIFDKEYLANLRTKGWSEKIIRAPIHGTH